MAEGGAERMKLAIKIFVIRGQERIRSFRRQQLARAEERKFFESVCWQMQIAKRERWQAKCRSLTCGRCGKSLYDAEGNRCTDGKFVYDPDRDYYAPHQDDCELQPWRSSRWIRFMRRLAGINRRNERGGSRCRSHISWEESGTSFDNFVRAAEDL